MPDHELRIWNIFVCGPVTHNLISQYIWYIIFSNDKDNASCVISIIMVLGVWYANLVVMVESHSPKGSALCESILLILKKSVADSIEFDINS